MPRPLRPGESPDARELNDQWRRTADAALPTGASGFLGIDAGIGGATVVDGRPARPLGRITSRGTGANYGWHQVIDLGDGTYADQPLIPETAWGTPTAGPAWELGGRTDVPTGGSVIVELVPGQQDGAAWYFRYDGPGGGSGSGSAGCCCELETVAFTVVTAVDLVNCTVTTKRVVITGCNLSLVQTDPPTNPSGGGAYSACLDAAGEPLESHGPFTLTIPDGPYVGTYTLDYAGGQVWQVGVGEKITLRCDGGAWNLVGPWGTAAATGVGVGGGTVALTWPGAAVGGSSDATAVSP
jgi:hypothetical protein